MCQVATLSREVELITQLLRTAKRCRKLKVASAADIVELAQTMWDLRVTVIDKHGLGLSVDEASKTRAFIDEQLAEIGITSAVLAASVDNSDEYEVEVDARWSMHQADAHLQEAKVISELRHFGKKMFDTKGATERDIGTLGTLLAELRLELLVTNIFKN